MRSDMKKLITRRPRGGGGHRTMNKYRVRDVRYYNSYTEKFEPKRLGICKPHSLLFGMRELRDYWAPLRRFLRSRVGRKWDDVYSEVCRTSGSKGVLAHHLKTHVKEIVGGIGHSGLCVGWTFKRGEADYRAFYVDNLGILRYNHTNII